MGQDRPYLLLTRPQAACEAFWAALPPPCQGDVDVLINPLMSIDIRGVLPDFAVMRGVIFTSANALEAYAALGGTVLNIPAIAVGPTTGAAVRAFGFETDIAGGTADQVVSHIVEHGYTGPLVHLRGEHTIGEIAPRLCAAGVETTEAVLYSQKLETLSKQTRQALAENRPVIAPVFSPRSAARLKQELMECEAIRFAAISPAVAEALGPDLVQRSRVAQQPNRDSMIRMVCEMIKDAT